MREIKIRAWDNELKEMLYSKTDWQFFTKTPDLLMNTPRKPRQLRRSLLKVRREKKKAEYRSYV